jgi:hypothetical protein
MGDVFDSVPAQTSTPAATQQSAQPTGDVFDQVGQPGAPAAIAQTPDQPSATSRLLSGFYDNTLGPVVSLGKELKSYYDNKSSAQTAIDAAGGPVAMLVDAATDPNHPLHKLGAGIVNSALDQVKQAASVGVDAATAEKVGLKALVNGNLGAANAAGAQVGDDAVEASGHAMAAALPGIGPAAVNAGQKIGTGDVAGGLGEGAGLIGATLVGGEAAQPEDVMNAAKGVAGNASKYLSEDAAAATAQPAAQSAVRSAAQDVAADEAVTPQASPSVRDAVQNVADQIMGRSKDAFQTLDDASGGRWQRFDDQLSNLRDKMDEVSGIDDDAYAKFDQRAKDVEAAQSDLIDSLVKDGKIDPDLADSAKNDYKQASALYDLSGKVRQSASGRRPELGQGTPEAVDPVSLSKKLNQLYDSGRLQQALGQDGAGKLLQQVDDAAQTKVGAIKTVKLLRTAATVAGIGGSLLYGGHSAVAHILGGQ